MMKMNKMHQMQGYRVEIDLHTDWINLLRRELESAGYHLPGGVPKSRIPILYHSVVLRHIPMLPRKIFVSKEFTCPSKHRAGLAALKRKMLRGDDLTPHLSKKIRDAAYSDLLLNDWGIHHFHLGLEKAGDRFVKRTGPLLYAYVSGADIYFLDVMDHGSFSQPRLISIIEANWPELLRPVGVGVESGERLTAGEIHEMRKAGIMTLLTASDGSAAYLPSGQGYSTTGTSVKALRRADYEAECIKWLQREVEAGLDRIVLAAREKGVSMGPEFKFVLIRKQGKWSILEKISNVEVFYLEHQNTVGLADAEGT